MRPAWLALVIAAAVLVGCGPSAGQLADARNATYQGDRRELLEVVVAEVQRHQRIDPVDRATGVVTTKPAERTVRAESRELGSTREVITSRLVIALIDGPPYRVRVEPRVSRVAGGAPYRMQPDDPQFPGWVRGQVEELQLALHRRLRMRFASAPARPGIGAPAAP